MGSWPHSAFPNMQLVVPHSGLSFLTWRVRPGHMELPF